LGVIFDNHLTWKAHIDYLVEKSKKCLNVVRCVSGTSWGSNKNILLTIYKAIILSLLDYCCFVYSNTAISNSKKLDTIQYKALLLATGGIKGTSLYALLGECGELPLAYRRKQLTINYLLKLQGNKLNSANIVLEDKKYFQLEKVCKSKYRDLLDDFLRDIHVKINLNDRLFNLNPWKISNDNIDLTFLEQYPSVKLNDSNIQSQIINDIFHTQCDKYDHLIYVDASVNSYGKVGAALFAPSLNLQIKIKLPDHLSIYYAEAYAIYYSLKTMLNANVFKFCLFSDSTTVLNHIKYRNIESSPHPYLIRDISVLLTELHTFNFIVKWMPGHTNHPDSITVDKLAKLSSSSNNLTEINYSRYEALLEIEPWICSSWLKEWEVNPKGKYQHTYKPTMNRIKLQTSRKKEVIINRLRLLHTKLNLDCTNSVLIKQENVTSVE